MVKTVVIEICASYYFVPYSNGVNSGSGEGEMSAKLQAEFAAMKMFVYFIALLLSRDYTTCCEHRIANNLRTTRSSGLLPTSGWGREEWKD